MSDEPGKKLVKSAYDDLASPAMREAGRVLGGAVRAVLSPVSFAILTVDEAFRLAQDRVQERFERWRVPPERVTAPPIEIAEPIVRLLRFPNQDSVLRELYLNLLARSMDTETQSKAHPAFVEVLKQLSPYEASLLSGLE